MQCVVVQDRDHQGRDSVEAVSGVAASATQQRHEVLNQVVPAQPLQEARHLRVPYRAQLDLLEVDRLRVLERALDRVVRATLDGGQLVLHKGLQDPSLAHTVEQLLALRRLQVAIRPHDLTDAQGCDDSGLQVVGVHQLLQQHVTTRCLARQRVDRALVLHSLPQKVGRREVERWLVAQVPQVLQAAVRLAKFHQRRPLRLFDELCEARSDLVLDPVVEVGGTTRRARRLSIGLALVHHRPCFSAVRLHTVQKF
mmetsp:Transcript_3464/g.10031  ORF Transcript_3464/g.10031 Transcript_3464/m.10031 type:complete len:254 (-) Transcript_3464:788-1549(-)